MLYKSSDGDSRPNLTVLSQLVEQHGSESDEVNAFMALYEGDSDFIKKASKILNEEENNDESE